MGSVGNNQNYVRFGEVPKNEESINYLKLTNEQKEDIRDAIDFDYLGDNIRDYIEKQQKIEARIWKNVNIDDVFEKGVSVFKADSSGMPIIENLSQAKSLATRIEDKEIFAISGDTVGTGQDKEPVLVNTKSSKISIDSNKLTNYLIKILKDNFKSVKGKKDLSGSKDILKFTDTDGSSYYVYKGLEFRKPKKNFI